MELKRKIPIDFEDIRRQSGLPSGKLCKSPYLGWVVHNTHGLPGPDVATIDPPRMEGEENFLRIEGNHWCFYSKGENE